MDNYTQLAYSVSKNDKFAMSQHVTEFQLDGMLEEPDEALHHALDAIINKAISNAEEGGNIVYKIGIMLDGDVLSDPILMPLRPPEQNTADVLMAEIEKLGQSGDGEGMDKRTLLLSRPMKLIVTCLTPPTGSGGTHFYPYQFYGYNNDQRIRINNTGDRFCLFYALVAARKYHDYELYKLMPKAYDNAKDFCKNYEIFGRLIASNERLQRLATQLMIDTGIRTDLNSYGMEHLQPVQDYWDKTDPGMYRIVLFEHRPEELPRPMWKGPPGRRFNVAIFMSEGHYDGIKKIHCFFKLGRKYCVECESSYQRDEKHSLYCKSRCYQCGKVGPEYPCIKENDVKIKCVDCNRFFFSHRCFDNHRPQMCYNWKRCDKKCQRVYQFNPKEPHKCFTSYCSRCKVHHEKDVGCFIQKVNIPEEKQRYRIVAWDTETRLEQMEEGQQMHKVNYLSARVTCTDCCESVNGQIDDCEICINLDGKTEMLKDWSEADGHLNPVASFVEWILNAWNSEFETYIFAHNSSRFDGHFVFKHLAQTGRRPEVVMNGLRLYEFKVQQSRQKSMLIWRDSCLMMPIKLEDLKATFNLTCDDKPFFPYAFNKRENYKIRLPHLPSKEDYCPGSMKRDKFEKFEQWYEENKNSPFYLPDELRSYCRNDTEILLKALVEFRRILLQEVTHGFDVLPLSCTIARACMNIFLAQYMNEKEIARVPEGGYERNDRASLIAMRYLEWRELEEGIAIQHAGNGREKHMKGYKLDGWIEGQKKAIEVMGCIWHGCERCFNPEDVLFDGKTCREINEQTQDRLRQLREPDSEGNCIQIEEIWECDINAKLGKDDRMKKFFDDIGNAKGPIDPRKAYCGGRTGPLKLFAEADDNYKLSVWDIISLYPWVNFDTLYPVGIPKIIIPTIQETNVNWTSPNELKYRGLYHVRIIPPRGLRIPVLPVKLDERLLFGLCHRCASQFRKDGTKCQHKCSHSEGQRSFSAVYTHIELERALENGYKVDRFWRAWHYDNWSDQIFKGYVQQFLKLKIESSGLPKDVQTEQQKKKFVDDYKCIYGVDLDLKKMKKNPGLRFIAKLCLNSLWGKFSMRNTLGENKVITRPQEFYKILFNNLVEITAIVPLSDDAIRVLYKPKTGLAKENSCSNIIISLWTTSRARLKLLDYMQQIERTEGAELLYTDTDSAIVRHLRDKVPIQTGEFLGQMSEEYEDYDIKSFVCGGAKQYGLKMVNKKSGETEYVQKIRGITFDVKNSQELQFENFKQKVLKYGKNDEPAMFTYNKIQPSKESNIITREQRKKYLPVCQKGIINDNLEVLPFGYE